jgi:protein phosphatase
MTKQSLVDTDEIALATPRQAAPQTTSSLVEVDLGGLSHRGTVRANNEDTFFVARFDRIMRALLTNLAPGEYPAASAETSYGMLVADGMGGHAGGEVASRTAVRVLLELVLQTPDWVMRLDDAWLQEVIRRMEQRVQLIGGALAEMARDQPGLSGMGTTFTLACSLGADLLLVHVGDSRAYLMHQGQLRQLTRDQTVAQRMVEAGLLSAEEAAGHRLRHVLTGVVGADGQKVPVACGHFRLADGDQVLLCSDGLTEMVPEAAVAEVLRRPGAAEGCCRALVDLALEAGGRDNVTVVLARYRFPGHASPS